MSQGTTFIVAITISALVLIGLVLLVSRPTNPDTSAQVAGDNATVNNNITSEPINMKDKADRYTQAPEQLPADQLTNVSAVIKTSKGDITVELDGVAAPLTVSNFIFLSEEQFYDNLMFHRVEPGFVVQGGDPLGDGTGGPGYTVPAEVDNGLQHTKGAIAMARRPDMVNPEKASSGSQFYITLAATPFLDGEYTVFGYVTSGMDVVENIEIGDEIQDIEIRR